jgi:hypothetical protein
MRAHVVDAGTLAVMKKMKKKWYYISTGQFGYPQPENGYEEITYSKSIGCNTCEMGKVQINPFRFRKEPKAKNSQFLGLNWIFDQIFVREIVKNKFEEIGLTGLRFSKPIIHKSEKELESIYQLNVDTILPKALIGNNLSTETCEMPKDKKMLKFLRANKSRLVEGPFCNKIKYNFPQGQIMKFESEAFVGSPDFIRTYEWFGSGGSANRPILISEKVKDIISDNKWRGAFLQEIELIEKNTTANKA